MQALEGETRFRQILRALGSEYDVELSRWRAQVYHLQKRVHELERLHLQEPLSTSTSFMSPRNDTKLTAQQPCVFYDAQTPSDENALKVNGVELSLLDWKVNTSALAQEAVDFESFEHDALHPLVPSHGCQEITEEDVLSEGRKSRSASKESGASKESVASAFWQIGGADYEEDTFSECSPGDHQWASLTQRMLKVANEAAAEDEETDSDASEHERASDLLQKQDAHVIHKGLCSGMVSSPTSSTRLVWDTSAVVLITYELISFPLSAFDLPPNEFSMTMGWVTAIFWLCDLPSQFFVGYLEIGAVEMRLSKTATRYIRSWLLLDLIIVATDWVFIIIHSSSDLSAIMRMGKTLRVVRILKALRMVRIGKFMELFQKILDRSGVSEGFMIGMRIIRLLIGVLFINHFVACTWYLIGKSEIADRAWVSFYQLEEESFLYQYSISLHWSLAQLTPGGNEIVPKNSYERLFGILMLIFGMVAFSSFVSKITSQMTQLAHYNLAKATQDYNLRTFIRENRVSSVLASSIWSYLRANDQTVRYRVHETQVQLLEVIPEQILIDLHVEIYSKVLLKHPLFYSLADCSDDCSHTFYTLCHKAMSAQTVLSRHLLFIKGELAKYMSFCVAGALEYTRKRPHGLQSNPDAVRVPVAAWVGEPVLWDPHWVHRGFLVAGMPSEVFLLDAAKFTKLTAMGIPGHAGMMRYSKEFTKRIIYPQRCSAGGESNRSMGSRVETSVDVTTPPPCLLNGPPSQDSLGKKPTSPELCDGVEVLWEMASGAFPSQANTKMESFKRLSTGYH